MINHPIPFQIEYVSLPIKRDMKISEGKATKTVTILAHGFELIKNNAGEYQSIRLYMEHNYEEDYDVAWFDGVISVIRMTNLCNMETQT